MSEEQTVKQQSLAHGMLFTTLTVLSQVSLLLDITTTSNG